MSSYSRFYNASTDYESVQKYDESYLSSSELSEPRVIEPVAATIDELLEFYASMNRRQRLQHLDRIGDLRAIRQELRGMNVPEDCTIKVYRSIQLQAMRALEVSDGTAD